MENEQEKKVPGGTQHAEGGKHLSGRCTTSFHTRKPLNKL